MSRPGLGGPAAWVGAHLPFSVYIASSIAVCILLALDPLFNPPFGLLTPQGLFASGRGPKAACSYDYEGSWQLGTVRGHDPLALQISNQSVLTCASLANFTAASYVAQPFLLVPLAVGKSSIAVALSVSAFTY